MSVKRPIALTVLGGILIGVAAHLGAQEPPAPFTPKKPKLDKSDEIPKLEEVAEGFEAMPGLFTVHRKKNRVLLEVPEQYLGRVFLLAMSVSGGTSFSGWQWSDFPAAWERNEKKLVLIEREVRYRFDEKKPLGEVVKRTYSDRVLKAVPIVALHGGNPVIDLGELLGGHAGVFFGGIGSMLDASVLSIAKLKPFPHNLEVAVTMPDRTDGQLTTLFYSFSELPDPRGDDYHPRAADDRIGYFLTAVKDFTDDRTSGDRFVRWVNRWDLRKRDPSIRLSQPWKPIVFYVEKTVPDRYRRFVREGILEWNKAFEKCGFDSAMVVHQQSENNDFAGYDPEDARYNFFRWITSERAFAMGPSRVNPYTGQILDADIIFDDSMARYFLKDYELLIRQGPGRLFFSPEMQQVLASDPERYPMAYVPPELAKLDGPARALERETVVPDRTGVCSFGEGIMHELGFAAIAGLAEAGPKPGQGPEWPEEFIGQVIKETVMHEVGHTLGLRHNFKASSWRPLAEINGKDQPEATSGSVMDYNAINVRPRPGVPQGHYAPTTIGPYDYWAIEYGYKPLQNEKDELAKIGARVAENGLAYGTDEDTAGPDPLVNRWDLGADPLEFAQQRMDIAASLQKDLVERLVKQGDGYQEARKAFGALLFEMSRSGLLAARFVGGEHNNRDHKGDPNGREPIVPVPAAKQREALKFICENVFTDARFRFPPELIRKLAAGRWDHWGSNDWTQNPSFPVHDQILNVQRWALFGLLNPGTLGRLVDQEMRVSEKDDALTLPELFDALDKAIFSEVYGDVKAPDGGKFAPRRPFISTVRRNLQRVYAGELIAMALGRGTTPQVARTVAWHHVKTLRRDIESALNKALNARDPASARLENVLDGYSVSHLDETKTRLEKALDASFQVVK